MDENSNYALKAHDLYWTSYLNGQTDVLASLLDENYLQIGSVEEEVFFNKTDAVGFVKKTIDQVAGRVEMRNRVTKSEKLSGYILINEFCDLYVKTDEEWNFYAKFRASSLMQKKADGWKLVHQHSSLPDSKTEQGENIAIEKINQENLDLKNAIKRRTVELEQKNRELEIEAALERVRARSIAMQKSQELIEVVRQIGRELKEMGIEVHNSQIWTDISVDPNASINIWIHVEGQSYLEKFHFPLSDHPIDSELNEAIDKGQAFFAGTYSKSEAAPYFRYAFKETDLKKIPQERKDIILNAPGWTRFTVVLEESCLHFGRFNLNEFTDEEKEIFKRFGRVFGQAYTRFLDLKKAEEQAREAEIEAALERVRARSMGMHHSTELIEVVRLLDREIKGLGIQNVDATQIATDLSDPDEGVNIWIKVEEMNYLKKFHVPFIDHPSIPKLFKASRKKENFYTEKYSKAEKNRLFRLLFKYSDFRSIPEERKEVLLNSPGLVRSTVIHKNSALIFQHNGLDEFSEEHNAIFKRFGVVFEQTYTRFLDLQKAEEQAREAQIEAALERVRARSMAMQKSDELHDVLSVLFEQFDVLGIQPVNVFLSLFSRENRTLTYRATGTGGSRTQGQQIVSLDSLDVWKELFEKWRNDNSESVEVIYYEKEILPTLFGLLEETFSSMPENERLTIDHFPEGGYTAHGYTPFGYIGFNHTRIPTDEEKDILTKFASEFSRVYQRFLDIERAEAQARKAEIEASLERVRTKAMAMHSSKDIESATAVVFNELSRLGIDMERCGISLMNETPIGEIWSTPLSQESKEVVNVVTGYLDFGIHPILQQSYRDWREKKDFSAYKLVGDEVRKYYAKLEKQPEYKFPKVASYPYQQILNTFYFKEGGIFAFTVDELSAEAKDIIQKFTKVFAQTYTRFLDLQKAEEQALEAQIEAALERVRSRSLAMHKPDELQDVVRVVAEELKNTGVILDTGGAVICTYFQDSKDVVHWTATDDPAHPSIPYLLPYFEDELFDEAWASKNGGDDYFAKEFSYEVKNAFFNHAFEHSDYRQLPEEYKKIILESKSHGLAWAWSENSAIMIPSIQGDLPSEEEKKILVRFAKVFEQSFIRFLDLQKAEEQAREAKIETALEKVRSRTMGMQSSEELPGVANLMFLEVQALGIPAWSCGYCILLDDGKSSTCIMSSEGTLQKPFLLPHYGEVSFEEWDKFVQSDETFFTQELGGKAIESHYNFMKSLPQLTPIFRELEEAGLSLPTYQINHLCKISHGFLLFITYEQVPDAHDIFKRFTNVFEQTYTRFLDLKKAEKLALETARQSSLDRIRAEIGSMRSAEDLKQITPIIWDELKVLEIPFIRCGVFIIDEENEVSHTYLSTSQGDPIAALHLPFEDIPLVKNAVSSWKESKIYTEHWEKEDFHEWTQNLIDRGFIDSKKKYEAGSAPATLDLHFLPFKHGMLYIGNTEPLSQKSLDLGQSMAKAFSVAYDRYEDFNKLEQAKQKIEEAFRELEAAKDQLVQQEKLASLGQLTAGIAHEIKNPLNFVNNFSDLSAELVQEARDEVKALLKSPFEGGKIPSNRDQGDDPGTKSEVDSSTSNIPLTPLSPKESGQARGEDIIAILDDIEANLRIIHQHGTRADGIVKSMLQHSRGGSGKMEPTDVNALIKEYANLAFHGMRASKDPINVDIELDLDENVGEVEMIGEDFSRVILNLCNNAFDAMRSLGAERSAQGESYEPKLTVRTKRNDQSVTINIEDNGPGIPEDIKDKILQPFFTTKKGTQGTGLGLSITNDIVKAHGGELSVNSTSGSGSIFIITLKQ